MHKIKIISFIFVTFCIGILKYTNIAPNIVNSDYNENNFIKFIGDNLFKNEITVSNEKIEVIDYEVKDNLLYIYPINNQVILPLDGIITNKCNNRITISNVYCNFDVYLDDCRLFLYQYYDNNTVLGNCNNYYVIKADDYTNITRYLSLNYDEV